MKGWAALAALFAAVGCAQQSPDQAAADPAADVLSPGQASAVQLAPLSLDGEWRVAGVGGKPIDLPHAISASISADLIKVSSQCVTMAWSYRFEGLRLVTVPVSVRSCDRERFPEEIMIKAALDAPMAVSRTAGNGVEIASAMGSVLLFSQ